MSVSPITSEWLNIFVIAVLTAKLENCFLLFNSKSVLSSSYNFYLQLCWKNSETVLKPRKNTNFFCLVIYLSTEPGLYSVACESSYFFGKRWKYGKEPCTWYGNLFCAIFLFTRPLGIIHCEKIRVQSNPLKRYQNVKISIATSKAQSQYLKHNHKWTIWQILLMVILHVFIERKY